MICWVDLETSGLEPTDGVIMEVTAVVTDDDLERSAGINLVCLDSEFEAAWVKADPFVVEMHAGSGLYRQVVTSPDVCGRSSLNAALCDWWDQISLDHDLSEVPMAGNTVHFDRAWLKRHCPDFERRFNYRNIDMSTLNQLTRRWAPDAFDESVMTPPPAHRSTPDIEHSINLARLYRGALFDGMADRVGN